MILIADSGASKSDWILMNNKEEQLRFQLTGLNPYYLSTNETIDMLSKELTPNIEVGKVDQIYFYGAGCSTAMKCMILEDAFVELFKNAEVYIESDLLGAARALLGKNEGLACILGTGSNSCYYNGEKIVQKAISLGYLFGDEGSGAHIGKQFIKDYLTGQLNVDLAEKFEHRYNYTRENILDAVYNLPFPNRFLASFGEFLAVQKADPYVTELIKSSFCSFFKNQVLKFSDYQKIPLAFSGSVAFHFEPLLTEVAEEYDLEISKVIKAPIESLAEYHR